MKDTYRHKGLRKKLVDVLMNKGITNEKVLDAIATIPRHLFISSEFESYAYNDTAFPISSGQTISQPYTVAYQTQMLDIKPGEKILEIGTGSGYQAAVLAHLGANLFSVERIEKLHLSAKRILRELNYNATLIYDDGSLGLGQYAPYDKIIVTAGAPRIPLSYIHQLRIGGKIIIPVGKTKEQQKMVLATKTGEETISHEVLGDFKFVPLIGKQGWEL